MVNDKTARWAFTAWIVIALVITGFALAALTGCKATPSDAHTTHVGPAPTGKASASIIPKDTSVTFPKNQAETDYATAHGATWICGDSGMSYIKTPGACVGHGGPAEVVRR